jgi:5-aminolevulinate synthase
VDYEQVMRDAVSRVRAEGRYRTFAELERLPGQTPLALLHGRGRPRRVVVWCSNDYLGMSRHPVVVDAAQAAAAASGAGSGGTRNISGTTSGHVGLERELAAWHHKDAALVFACGYLANLTSLATLGRALPGCVVLSDAANHNSMIEGIRRSGAERHVFGHNDVEQLAALLRGIDPSRPRIVAFESVYSMDGDVAPIRDIVAVAKRFGAFTYLDEVHAVGMYGPGGAGVAASVGAAAQIDLIQGSLAKGVGTMGGYVAGAASTIDVIRSYGAGFIFTTSLPPPLIAAARASIRHLRTDDALREALHRRAGLVRGALSAAGLPVISDQSHIVAVMVGNADACRAASEHLLDQHGIYVQPINYPTVARGTERLRITPTPLHTDAMQATLVAAMTETWATLRLDRTAPAALSG